MSIEKHQTTTHRKEQVEPSAQPQETSKGEAPIIYDEDMTYKEAHVALDAFFLSEKSSHWVPHTTTIWKPGLVYFAKSCLSGANDDQIHDGITEAYLACFKEISEMTTQKKDPTTPKLYRSSTYILKIIRNKMIDQTRKKENKLQTVDSDISDFPTLSGRQNVEQTIIIQEQLQLLCQAFLSNEKYDPVDLAIFIWHSSGNYSYNEIAQHLRTLGSELPEFSKYVNTTDQSASARRNRIFPKVRDMLNSGAISSPF